MRTRLTIALLFVASLAVGAEIRGTWAAIVRGDRVQLNMMRDRSNWSRTLPRSDFAITDAQVNALAEAPVHFVMSRDAGTIDFNGTFESGEGVGRFTFTPSVNFASTLRSLGVAPDEALDDEKLFSLAMHDISVAFIREMQALGYRENLDTYVRFRIHGVTPQFVRSLKDLGYSAGAEDLVRFRIHGMTPEFATAMRDLQVKNLTAEQLVRMRIHGVSPDYVRELRDLGYAGLDSDDLVRMRIHGVTTEFIRKLAEAGYHGIPADKLVQMRIRGIGPEMLRQSQ